jgi:hypothetical protein
MEFEVNRPLKRVLKQIRYMILYQNKDWQNDSNELRSVSAKIHSRLIKRFVTIGLPAIQYHVQLFSGILAIFLHL